MEGVVSTEPTDDRPPSSCEPLTAEDLEFVRAIEAYKHKHNRPFPSWSEALRVLKSLGYRKQSPSP